MDKSPNKWKCPRREVLQAKFVLQLSLYDCHHKELKFDWISVRTSARTLSYRKKGSLFDTLFFLNSEECSDFKIQSHRLNFGPGNRRKRHIRFGYLFNFSMLVPWLLNQDSWAGRSPPPGAAPKPKCARLLVFTPLRAQKEATPLPLFLGHRTLIRNRTQSAVINIFNLLIFRNLTCRMLVSINFQKYCYNFENFTYMIVKRDWDRD